jgi:transposase
VARHKRMGKRSAQPGVVHPHAAGVDVGATAVYAAVRPDSDPKPIQRFSTFTRDLHALAKWLKACGVRTVAMESTGVYWIPVFQVLESCGFDVVLVNARHVKNVPGRKTDVADCEWLRYLHSVGLLRGSFRPADQVCAVRALLRHRDGLIKTASRSVQHMQKAFDQMNVHLHHALSDLTGRSGLRITDAILDGQRDPSHLAKLADRRVRASRDTLEAALEGDWRPEHLFTLGQARKSYAHYQQLIAECDHEIEVYIRQFESDTADPPPPAAPNGSRDHTTAVDCADTESDSHTNTQQAPFDLQAHLAHLFGADLTRIPGIGLSTAQLLFAEIGPDLSRFPTDHHFASWLNLCPHNKISGDKILSSRTGPGANRAAQALRWATQSLYRSPSYLGRYFHRMRARLGTPKAVTATAHKIARIIYCLVTQHIEYDESHFANHEQQHRKRTETRLRNQARSLGFQLIPNPA